ncbi:MAG TPA: FAD:protein FMN transferase [Lapillicoccus sp.]|nr:FAD:protein FMN transferase [Lapillicoccus sp.]
MSAQQQLHGPAYEWALWSTTVRVVTADARALPSARRLVDAELAHVELAAGPRRPDSELARLPSGRRVRVSSTLAAILGAALRAAEETDGALDPTTGRTLRTAGSDEPWRSIEFDVAAQTVLVPRGVLLDVDPIARAWAADRCAAVVADVVDVGVLVSLGGDIATAGPAGGGAWEVVVTGPSDDRAAIVAVPTGLAVATATASSGMAVRTATVVAADCVTAATWSSVALTDGDRLTTPGLPARLVAADGSLHYLHGWPEDAESIHNN